MNRKRKHGQTFTKKRCQYLHLTRRLRQRFGIALSESSYSRLKAMIGSGQARFLFRESCRVEHYFVPDFEGHAFEMVWDCRRRQIVTAFPAVGLAA